MCTQQQGNDVTCLRIQGESNTNFEHYRFGHESNAHCYISLELSNYKKAFGYMQSKFFGVAKVKPTVLICHIPGFAVDTEQSTLLR